MKADELKIKLPNNVSLIYLKKVPEGETNEVYYCQGILDRKNVNFFLKVSKASEIYLKNEYLVLQALQLHSLPVPHILFACDNKFSYIALEEIKGCIIWDLIDPRRERYDAHNLHHYLFEYGKWLAIIHQLPLKWTSQKRLKLYDFIDEKLDENPRLKRLISWLESKKPTSLENVFVHGDYNTGSVIFDEKEVKGIIDWEFAGEGWKEYDLAWALRARQCFLNSQEERNIILQGYSSVGSYNPISLRWCEVLNYLHFAYWTKKSDPEYMNFSLDCADKLLNEEI